jgi:hypothetical protein
MRVKIAFMFVAALVVAMMVAAPASATEEVTPPPTEEVTPPPTEEVTPPPPPPPAPDALPAPPAPLVFFVPLAPDDDGGNGHHKNRHDDQGNGGNPSVIQELDQDFEQEAESGDIAQSFDVSQTGDNSNQTVGTQGVANTGNAQNQIGLTQFGSDADDFEFDDVGSFIEVSPTNTTWSDQVVSQTAVAVG